MIYRKLRSQLETLKFKLFISSRNKAPKTRLNLLEEARLESQERDEVLDFLSIQLPKCPAWEYGHRQVVKRSLEINFTELAYNSTLALLSLAKTKKSKEAAIILKAQCLNRKRQFEKALSDLDLLESEMQNTSEVKELRVVSLMGLEKFAQARDILESIPKDLITKEAELALEFIHNM